MIKLKQITFAVMVCVSILMYLYFATVEKQNTVQLGHVNVSEALSKHNVIALDGEWTFYWSQFLSPLDFDVLSSDHDQFIPVPSTWGKGIAMDARGYGTYRLVLENLEPGVQYGLIKKNIRIASKIYIDDKLLLSDGVPADKEDQEYMGNMPELLYFESKGTEAELIIQVSNFKYYSGGIVASLRLGKLNDVAREFHRNIVFEACVFTTLMVIGVVFAIMVTFFPEFRKREPAGFFLAITILAFAVVNGALSQRVIKLLFPAISTSALIRIEYVAISIFFVTLFIAIHLMAPRLLPKRWTGILSAIYIIFGIASLGTPLDFYLLWSMVSLSTITVLPILFIYTVIRFVMDNPLGILPEEHVLILMILYLINIYNFDLLLFTLGHKPSMNLALVSTIFYGILWFILIAYRVYMANLKLQETEQDLMMSNDELEVHRNEILAAYEHLEIEVRERTEALIQSNEKLQAEIETRLQNEIKIEKLAFYDHLTNIPNRRYFTDHFDKALANAERYHTTFTLLYLDLDGFKDVNDSYGHDAGDKLLQTVAEHLKEMVRAGDFVARLGGDEFVILLEHLEEEPIIKRICQDIIEDITAEMNILGHRVHIGVSIGVVIYPKHGVTKNSLVKKADHAMYEAKKSSEQKYVFAKMENEEA